MMNNFLFIIPLTPKSHLSGLRRELQELCLQNLLNQSYKNWTALLIGADKPANTADTRFIHLPFEGYKEAKLQMATKYIRESTSKIDYIIRLDDDDIINPEALNTYKSTNYDVIVDLKHYFLEWESKAVSAHFRPWFANSVLHKKEHALAKYGELSRPEIEKTNSFVSLIETDHSKMHNYYRFKQVVFTKKGEPIYLRVINGDSITASADHDYNDYLSSFGNWNALNPLGIDLGDSKGIKPNLNHKTLFSKMKNFVKTIFNQYSFKKQFKKIN